MKRGEPVRFRAQCCHICIHSFIKKPFYLFVQPLSSLSSPEPLDRML
ncbi:hypothetical protein HanXRQr2_Chr08g0343241 [Helianthus annuus]|uniref:Uncharacterized protein n=1 Tax=Helianthus annuus TaxID=4232 RepID=A0A9K3IG87_HELAN|nr:hypothetical protein HanXRQr2_Chr08g0343241 [Helianthus annuus]